MKGMNNGVIGLQGTVKHLSLKDTKPLAKKFVFPMDKAR